MDVRAARDRIGMTQAELARRVGVAHQFVSLVEAPEGSPGRRPASPLILTALYLLGGMTAAEALAIRADLPLVGMVERGELAADQAWGAMGLPVPAGRAPKRKRKRAAVSG